MEIKRDILNGLKEWKVNRYRKPLVLQGARQVGKSFILKNSVEVKSSLSTKSKSLSEFRKKFQPELSIRFSLKNIEKNNDLLNLPLYLTDYAEKIFIVAINE